MLNYKEWNDHQRLAVKVRIFFRLQSFCIFFDCSSFKRITSLPNQILLHEQRTTENFYAQNTQPRWKWSPTNICDAHAVQVGILSKSEFFQDLFPKIFKQCSSPTTIISILVKIWLMNQKKRKIYHKFTRISCFNVVNVFINIQPFKISRRKNIN